MNWLGRGLPRKAIPGPAEGKAAHAQQGLSLSARSARPCPPRGQIFGWTTMTPMAQECVVQIM